jgi:cytochrome c553
MAVETSRGIYITATLVVAAVGFFAFAVGFFVLPGEGSTPGTVWQRMCRAAGVGGPSQSAPYQAAAAGLTSVVVPHAVSSAGTAEQIGHGATLALRCTVCHGARGMSRADAPNLAAQYPDVIYKQLLDYQRGARTDPVMTAMAASLSTDNVLDLAHYYASLRREPTVQESADAPALVRVGDPMRNIAPCASCHGAVDRKKGAPSLVGEPAAYLIAQLAAFAGGTRRNDANAVMRSVARGITEAERGAVANYYAGIPP